MYSRRVVCVLSPTALLNEVVEARAGAMKTLALMARCERFDDESGQHDEFATALLSDRIRRFEDGCFSEKRTQCGNVARCHELASAPSR